MCSSPDTVSYEQTSIMTTALNARERPPTTNRCCSHCAAELARGSPNKLSNQRRRTAATLLMNLSLSYEVGFVADEYARSCVPKNRGESV